MKNLIYIIGFIAIMLVAACSGIGGIQEYVPEEKPEERLEELDGRLEDRLEELDERLDELLEEEREEWLEEERLLGILSVSFLFR